MAVQGRDDLALGDASGSRHEHRDLDGRVEHVRREGAVALAVDAVMPHVHAVVAGEHHQGVFAFAVFLQPVQQPSHVRVHLRQGGEVSGKRFLSFFRRESERTGCPLLRQLERMHGNVGSRLERAVLVVVVPQFGRVMLSLPGRVRCREVNVQAKRAISVLLRLKEP